MKHFTELRVSFAGEPVGLLKLHDRQYWFQYEASWLQHGFDLAPTSMSFNNAPQLAKLPIFQGLHGPFYDSLPDGWGMLLMDRFFKQTFSWDTHEITPMDRLAYLGTRAMGALEYEPTFSENPISEHIDLNSLIENSIQILSGKSSSLLNQLRVLGGSPGGARPKVALALADNSDECVAGLTKLPPGFNHWLVKFHGQADPRDIGCIEKAYAELAMQAGLEVSPNRLMEIKHSQDTFFFAVKRFDREGYIKHHMLTLSGYLYADHRLPCLDYNALLATTALLTKDIREVQRAFRLMVFNVATHNKDDHAKNFAFLCNRAGQWRLAPAFDLTFSTGLNNQHTTAINGAGNPSRKDLAAIATAHDIENWEEIISEVLLAIDHWKMVAERYHVTKLSTKNIAKAFDSIKNRIT